MDIVWEFLRIVGDVLTGVFIVFVVVFAGAAIMDMATGVRKWWSQRRTAEEREIDAIFYRAKQAMKKAVNEFTVE